MIRCAFICKLKCMIFLIHQNVIGIDILYGLLIFELISAGYAIVIKM